jgi:UDP-N-acetylglucosamine 2-epimerase (non-hydrolysing)
MSEFGIRPMKEVIVINPLGYPDFLKLWSNSLLVLTDSGGLQEETTTLGIPCLTLRENTERPITISQGTNHLVGLERERIVTTATKIIRGEYSDKGARPELWDGHAAERIVNALIESSRNAYPQLLNLKARQ